MKRNADLVRQGMESWSRGNLDATLELIDPRIVWRPVTAWPGIQPEYRGHDGVRRFWDAFREPWEEITLEADEIRELDDHKVLTRSHFRGRGRASGVTTELRVHTVWTVENGKLVRFESFTDEQAAVDAAERAEPLEERSDDRLRAH
jgi:ketosteroid isomerase-like protein